MRPTKCSIALLCLFLLAFSSCSADGTKATEQSQKATEAIKALRKVEAATQVGVNYQQYSSLIIEAKAAVNEANSILSQSELKAELNSAIENFVDAREGWGEEIGHGYFSSDSEGGKKLIKKYNLSIISYPVSPNSSFIDQKDMLNKIWTQANDHISRAQNLTSK